MGFQPLLRGPQLVLAGGPLQREAWKQRQAERQMANQLRLYEEKLKLAQKYKSSQSEAKPTTKSSAATIVGSRTESVARPIALPAKNWWVTHSSSRRPWSASREAEEPQQEEAKTEQLAEAVEQVSAEVMEVIVDDPLPTSDKLPWGLIAVCLAGAYLVGRHHGG